MLVRKRYYVWLVRAYIKKWKRTIFTSIIIGILLFFLSFSSINFYIKPIIQKKVTKIGYTGGYKINQLPEEIFKDISFGLTQVASDGSIRPAAAKSWRVQDNGREYIFILRRGLYFHNGKELTTDTLPLQFSDVIKKNLDKYTVSYTLKNPYSPFFVSVSRPIILSDLSGLGEYKVKKLELNAGFVKSFVLHHKKNTSLRKDIYFYPTKDALKTTFWLKKYLTIKPLHLCFPYLTF